MCLALLSLFSEKGQRTVEERCPTILGQSTHQNSHKQMLQCEGMDSGVCGW